ncbi:MAG: formate dehydrogenase accessory protein FdhE, partial [Gemmatimonadaceae bacterium]
AADSGVPAGAFAVVAQSAAIPILRAALVLLDASAANGWQRSYCLVCGARPTLAEVRGIERERRLRCGACSADWPLALLHCAFCDEVDHEKLGALSVEGEGQLRRVETCESCHGYLKSATTFDALSFRALMLLDLATIPLDIVAHERGYARPSQPGWAPHVELAT